MTNEELVFMIKRGDTALIGELWERVYDFVHVKALSMHAGDLTEDLEQECYFALLDAVDNFDDMAGCKFLTYAGYWFKARMHRYLAMKGGGPILPVNLLPRLRKYRRVVSDFQRDNGRRPSGAEVIAITGWTLADLIAVVDNQNADKTVSTDAPLSDETENITLADTIAAADDPAETVEDAVFHEQMQRDVWRALDELPEQVARVISDRFKNERPHKDIGADMGISEGKTRQICAKGLRMIRSDEKAMDILRPYAVDLYGEGMRGSFKNFLVTGVSSTERAAFKDLGMYF